MSREGLPEKQFNFLSIRTTIRFFLTALVAIGIIGSTTLLARASNARKYDIAPNSSIKVEVNMTNEHFVWWAEVGQVPAGGNQGGDGIDLTDYTDDDNAPVKAEPSKKPTKKDEPTKKPVRPGLPHTGN